MKRFQTTVTIQFTAKANSKNKAREMFIDSMNHLNLLNRDINIKINPEEFSKYISNTEELPF